MKKSLLLILGIAVALYADHTMVLQMGAGEDGRQTIEYKDDKHVKISMGPDGSMMIIGDKAYMVSTEDGKTTVMDMDEMRAMLGGMGGGMKQRAQAAKHELDMKVIKKGKKRTVAGIKGQVWTVQFNEDGKAEQMDVVVTDDKRVVKAMGAYGKAISRMAMSAEESDDEFLSMMMIEPGHVMIASEEDEDGNKFELQSFSDKSIAASTFVLPANAEKQQMPNLAGLFGGGGQKSADGSKQKGLLSDCYDKVCCGSTDGDAKVLTSMLSASEGGFKLHGTPSVCNILGISSFFGSGDHEGALYKKGKDDYIQITLNMDDAGEGSVQTSREQVKMGMGMVHEVKDYKKGSYGSSTYYYGYLEPMHQQTLDIMLDNGAMLSVSRIAENKKIDMIDWAEGAIDLGAYGKSKTKAASSGDSKKGSDSENSSLNTDAINEGVDDAVEMFKSFF